MFAYSACDMSDGVAHVLCSTARCCAYDKVNNVFGFAVEELFRVCRFIGNLCLRVVLFAKHLVSNKGHIAHAWQQRLIGFLTYCRLLLNILCGLRVFKDCSNAYRMCPTNGHLASIFVVN